MQRILWCLFDFIMQVSISLLSIEDKMYIIIDNWNLQSNGMIVVAMTKVELYVSEEIVPYIVMEDKDAHMTRGARLVYPYVKSGVISHGKTAEMLGLHIDWFD